MTKELYKRPLHQKPKERAKDFAMKSGDEFTFDCAVHGWHLLIGRLTPYEPTSSLRALQRLPAASRRLPAGALQ